MQKIKSKDTKPELILRKYIWSKGFRYRINYTKLPGNPDIVFLKKKVAIFVDGEFWHGYNWNEKKGKIKSNRDYWIPKIERTIERDKRNTKKLEELGYKVFRFWEHEIKKGVEKCFNEFSKYL